MLETWKRSVDKGKVFGALLICQSHLIVSIMNYKKQRTKIAYTYSTWLDIWGSARFNTRTTPV